MNKITLLETSYLLLKKFEKIIEQKNILKNTITSVKLNNTLN